MASEYAFRCWHPKHDFLTLHPKTAAAVERDENARVTLVWWDQPLNCDCPG